MAELSQMDQTCGMNPAEAAHLRSGACLNGTGSSISFQVEFKSFEESGFAEVYQLSL
jgi:hypothetical protein